MEIQKKIEGAKFEYIAIDKEQVLGNVKGIMFVPDKAGAIFRISTKEGLNELESKTILQAIGKEFYQYCLNNQVEIFCPKRTSREAVINFLEEIGLTIEYKKALYEKDLTQLPEPQITKLFTFKTLAEVGEEAFQKYLFQASQGDPTLRLEQLTASEYFQSEVRDAGDYFDAKKWLLATLEGEIVGILMIRIEELPNNKGKEGTFHYIGILPEHRAKGLGQQLHLQGLTHLKKEGCKIYFGSTGTENKGMKAIFTKNNCQFVEEQWIYTAK